MHPDPLLGVVTKIERAKKHFRDLEAEIKDFFASNAYSVVVQIDPQTEDKLYCLRINKAIPPSWGAIVGDCIHNLRSSLDLLATALVINGGGTPNVKHTKFPISSAERFVQHDIASGLQGASDASIAIVKRLKPYDGSGNPFWRLHQLDIVDKHRLLVPVAARHNAVRMLFDPNAMFEKLGAPKWQGPLLDKFFIDINPKDRQFPLKDGAILLVLKKPAQGLEDQTDYKPTIDIAFGEGQIVDGEPVLPALKQLIDFTESVIKIFGDSIFK